MNKQLYILWAFTAGVLNNFVQGQAAGLTTQPFTGPLSFRRGTDDIKLVHCDYDRPGTATVEMPDGGRDTVQLADGELGQLVTNYGRATGQRIELPPLVGYGEETQAASAGAGHGNAHP